MLGDDALQVQLTHALEEGRPRLLDVITARQVARMSKNEVTPLGKCIQWEEQAHQGKSQKPCSLNGRGEGNGTSGVH
jgi:hypothetical protein